jgi:hypothetical protein
MLLPGHAAPTRPPYDDSPQPPGQPPHTARAAPATLPSSRSSATKNLDFDTSKPTIPATP